MAGPLHKPRILCAVRSWHVTVLQTARRALTGLEAIFGSVIDCSFLKQSVCVFCVHTRSEPKPGKCGNILKQSFEIGSMNWVLELCETQTDAENCKIRGCVNVPLLSWSMLSGLANTNRIGKNPKNPEPKVGFKPGAACFVVGIGGLCHYSGGFVAMVKAPVSAVVLSLLELLVPALRLHPSVPGQRCQAGLQGTMLSIHGRLLVLSGCPLCCSWGSLA